MPACDHCLLEFPERDAVRDVIDGRSMVFCCHGCCGIYRLIHSEGLDAFYEKRRDWAPGPAEQRTLDVSAFIGQLRPAGGEVETDIILEGIRCASCVWLNERILLRTPGVSFASVNYATHRARIRWDPNVTGIGAVLSRIAAVGYTPKPLLPRAYEDEQRREATDLLIRFGTAAFFSMQLMLFSIALYAGYFQGIDERTKLIFHVISLLLTTPVIFYAGQPLIRGAVRGLRNRAFSMDLLIVTGALSAFIYSIQQMFTGGEVYFDTAAMIVTLILLGRLIEAGAKRKASETVTKLMQLHPPEARTLAWPDSGMVNGDLRTAVRTMVPLASLRRGDLVEVVPGERLPADGVVAAGRSEVDESMLTGESRPVAKQEAAHVYGGTVNLYGSFIYRITRTGGETMLAQLIKVVEDAQARRAPIQAVADRVAVLFVPAILVLAAFTFIGWTAQGAALERSIMHAVSVLVIACPCALGLATPLAILVGTSQAAQRGILIKGGDVIERTASVKYAVLDKTGTVTEGRPVLNACIGMTLPEQEVLCIAASLERHSEHSLGKAIADAAKGMELLEVSGFTAMPGRGVRGTVQGSPVVIGSREFVEAEGIGRRFDGVMDEDLKERIRSMEGSGQTAVYLSVNGVLAGVLCVADRVRTEAGEAVAQLQGTGMPVAMITGDNAHTASAVAADIGITDVTAQAQPAEKARVIRALKDAGTRVLMVGDGINDAPALVEATVGIAVARSTDIALESADIVILRPDLRLVPEAVQLSRKTLTIVRQNLFWAFFYNGVAIPLAMLGVLHPIVAAAAMALSSLSVVANSLRARLP